MSDEDTDLEDTFMIGNDSKKSDVWGVLQSEDSSIPSIQFIEKENWIGRNKGFVSLIL